jgi:hypothetical protein
MTEEPADLTIRLLREIRTELRECRSLLLSLASSYQRLDSHMDQFECWISDLKDHLERSTSAQP